MAPEITPPPGRDPGPPKRYGLLLPAVLAVVLSAALLIAQRRLDLTLNEEGFLWYGAVAAAHGEVPLRDFYSYDPGRYYWAAAWTPLGGEGLLGLRLATAAFGALGLFCGLLAARRAVANPLLLALLGVVLTLWLLPRHKMYEPAIQMAAVLAATSLLEHPSGPERRRHVAAGALVGFGLFMGKNHGLYLGVAFLALIVLLAWRGTEETGETAETAENAETAEKAKTAETAEAAEATEETKATKATKAAESTGAKRRFGGRLAPRVGAFLGGIALGAAPLAGMLAGVPGFARSYLDSILFFVREGRTNFPRPVPWPWTFDLGRMDAWSAAQVCSLGLCFLLTVVFFAAGGIAVLTWPAARLRRHALLAGAVVVGAVYTHYTFSRPDLAHLGSSIHPLLLGLAALPAAWAGSQRLAARPGTARRLRWAAGAAAGLLLAAITGATALPAQPLYRQLAGPTLVPCRIGGEDLLVRPRIAALLDWARREAAARIPPAAPVFLAPNLPGLYTVLGRRSPVFDIYPIWPAAGGGDDRMLAELRRHHVDWAIVQDAAVDGREELEFRHTHPETWRYIETNFRLVAALDPQHPWQCALLRRLQGSREALGPRDAPGSRPATAGGH
jgi:hypothetical protein